MIRRLATLVATIFIATASFAQQAIPTPDAFLGYKLGEQFTTWDRIIDYFETLAKSSNLVTLQTFGQTYEGRPLMLAVVTSPKNRAALDTIRQNTTALANATVDATRAAKIARANPAIVWLAFGVHGNESSSSEAAMRVAHTLVTDPQSATILDNTVVVIDPLQNPDGRERYVQWYRRTRGARLNTNPDAFEHTEPWPGGRYNHYLNDMNRDWAWTSQAETQARVAQFRQWNPQVFVDFHEMSYQSSYFFPPDAKPINANLPSEVERWLEVFGRANAEAFSSRSWPFFVGEVYDLFYPAYGDSWPSLHGAIGMTYEVAGGGRGGTAIEKDDTTILTLAHRIEQHYTTGMTTLRTAAQHREALLNYTYTAAKSQIDSGRSVYLVLADSPNFRPMMALLARQAVQIATLNAPLTVRATRTDSETPENRAFPAGTAVITTKQPTGRLVQSLLEKSPTFTKGFLERQRERTEADEPDEFYDLTSWSLPLAMNVESYVAAAPLAADVRPYSVAAAPAFRAAAYGYVVDGNEPDIYRFAGRLLSNKINFSVSEGDVSTGDRQFARGSLVILKGNNRTDLDATLARISSEVGATPFALESGWTGGTALGSERIRFVRDPKIAIVGGAGTVAASYGMLWHLLDVETEVPHTTLSLDNLRNVDLDRYRVLILPDGNAYEDRLGKSGIEKLQTWLRDGGTIVAVRGASAFLRDKDVEISKIKPWEPPKKKDDDTEPKEERYNEYRVPGSAFHSVINQRSYLTFGVPRPPAVLIEGTIALQPVPHKVDNVVTIDTKNPLASGVAWPESLDRLKGAPYLVREQYGRGLVITFADEPNYRSFWRATLPLFMNAVMYSPSFLR